MLIHAHRREMPLHQAALAAVRALAEEAAAWALPVFCLGEFVRVVSHTRVFAPPTPTRQAFAAINALLASPSARLLSPGPRYLPLFEQIVDESGATGNLIFDAQIAAVCLEHGARTLLTEDRDFARFRGITVMPLSSFGGAAGR